MINRLKLLSVSSILIFVLCTSYFVLIPSRSSRGSEPSSKYQVQSTKSETDNSKDPERHRPDSESHLLELGQAPKIRTVTAAPADIKVVSFNIRWRGGKELQELVQRFKDDPEIGGASILGLQEVDRNKKRTGNKNTAKILADELGMHYAWAAPGPPESESQSSQTGKQGGKVAEEETGVVILSSYPLSQVQRIVLPHKGPGRRRRVALGATVSIGQTSIRIYSVHSETRISVDKKLDQMKAVLEDLAHHRKGMPAVVLGDLNTWEPKAVDKTFKLFTAENFQTPFDKQATFCRRVLFVPIKLKLDWIWLRNLDYAGYGINRRIELSDHWPLWVIMRTKPGAA